MSPFESRPSISQVSIGETVRIAGHIYVENVHVDNVTEALALMPEEQRDALAISNDIVFQDRYRFDGPRDARQQVIGIKQGARLTDGQVRWLYRTGVLRIKEERAWLSPSLTMELVGYTAIAYFMLTGGSLLLTALLPNHAALQIQLKEICVSIAFLLVTPVYYRIYVNPNQMARRANRRLIADQQKCH